MEFDHLNFKIKVFEVGQELVLSPAKKVQVTLIAFNAKLLHYTK